MFRGVSFLDPICFSAVMPADWSNYSDSNIKKAECEKQASVTLRSVISGVIEQTRNDLLTQCRNVDLALKKRVEECSNAKERLTAHLDKVSSHANFLHDCIDYRNILKFLLHTKTFLY